MSSDLFRNRLVSKIRAAKAEYEEVASMSHNLLKGRIREIAVQNLLAPLLSADFQIGSGTIVDIDGKPSAETDLIIYSNKLLPPIVYGERLGTFPLDSCIATVEVKSKLTATELEKTLRNASKMPEMKYSSYKRNANTQKYSLAVVTRTLFAFDSDLSRKSEFERYKEKDSKWQECPLIKEFCVFGKGTWIFNTPKREWRYIKANENHDEVVFFLTSITDHLTKVLESRAFPKLQNYISLGKPVRVQNQTGSI